MVVAAGGPPTGRTVFKDVSVDRAFDPTKLVARVSKIFAFADWISGGVMKYPSHSTPKRASCSVTPRWHCRATAASAAEAQNAIAIGKMRHPTAPEVHVAAVPVMQQDRLGCALAPGLGVAREVILDLEIIDLHSGMVIHRGPLAKQRHKR